MNAAPPPDPHYIPVGKLEPAKPLRKPPTPSQDVFVSPGYHIPAPPAVAPTVIPAQLAPPAASSRRAWALVAIQVGLLCLVGAIIIVVINSGKNDPPPIAPVVVAPKPEPPAPDQNGKGTLDNNKEVKPAPKVDGPARGPEPVTPVTFNPEPKPRPAPPAWKLKNVPDLKQEDIDRAIERGVAYLKKTQQQNGTWQNGGHAVGYAALPGLTLLECGVPASDPKVQLAARFVRNNVASLPGTYELSLAVLFLDRLGDVRDRGLIQNLSLRLVASQHDNGGWGYTCSVLPPGESAQLLTFLQANRPARFQNPLPKASGPLDNPLGKEDFFKLPNPLAKPGEPPLQNPLAKQGEAKSTPGEKGLIQPVQGGGAPAKDPKATPPPKNKAKSPGKNAGRADFLPPNLRDLPIVINIGKGKGRGWQGRLGRDDNSNSQFALLALWAARRHDVPTERTLKLAQERYQKDQHNEGAWGYQIGQGGSPAMTCVGLLGMAMGHGVSWEVPDAAQPPQGDPVIQKGLKHLGNLVGQPRPSGQPVPLENLYFLWSVERVAMLYNLPAVSGRDWYGWGAQGLVKNQQGDGHWQGGGYHGSTPPLDTSFALLFLKRSNLVQDLTEELPRFVTIIEAEKRK